MSGNFFRLPPCILHDYFHIYCPGCGATRAAKALWNLHPLISLHYNPFPFVLLLYFVMFFLTIAMERKKKKRGQYRKIRRYLLFFLLFFYIAYGIWRDYLLLYRGIDLLGDFS